MNNDEDIKPLVATRDTPDELDTPLAQEVEKLSVNNNSKLTDSLSTLVIAAVVGFFSYLAADISASSKLEAMKLTEQKIKVLNIPSVADKWSKLETNELQFAITELVKGYTDSGYLVIDSKYALGDVPESYLINIADIDVVKAELDRLKDEGKL